MWLAEPSQVSIHRFDVLHRPWISKTPQNSLEANPQSELIKTRISNEQNSSPTSMLKAVDQFAKGKGYNAPRRPRGTEVASSRKGQRQMPAD